MKLKIFMITTIMTAVFSTMVIWYAGTDETWEYIPNVERIETKVQEEEEYTPPAITRDVVTLDKESECVDPDVESIAKIIRAEAGNQDEFGKRLVADVVLNRVDSDDFPNTVSEVINQKNQFAKGYYYTEEDLKIAQEETECRIDYQIVYFRTREYHKFGIPAFQHGDHFFSITKEEN